MTKRQCRIFPNVLEQWKFLKVNLEFFSIILKQWKSMKFNFEFFMIVLEQQKSVKFNSVLVDHFEKKNYDKNSISNFSDHLKKKYDKHTILKIFRMFRSNKNWWNSAPNFFWSFWRTKNNLNTYPESSPEFLR